MKPIRGPILCALIAVTCVGPLAGILAEASAHDAHEHFVAGEPGDPKKPFRVVKVTMLEDGKTMLFAPAIVKVHRGEQVRFEIFNEGSWNHEFVLATEEANHKHAELMKKSTPTPTRYGYRRCRLARSCGSSPGPARSNIPVSSRAIVKPACTAR